METTKSQAPVAPVKRRRGWVRFVKWFSLILLLSCAGVGYFLKDHVRTLYSLRRVPNTNLYVMDYYADYHLDEVRTHGIDVNNIEDSFLRVFLPDIVLPIATRVKRYYVPARIQTVDPARHHCSSGVLKTPNGEAVFGYNCDYKNDAALIVNIRVQTARSSVAVLDLAYLNMNHADLEKMGLLTRLPLLFPPYYLLSGMNEHGFAISGLSLSGVCPPSRSLKAGLALKHSDADHH